MVSISSNAQPLTDRINEYSLSRSWLQISRARAFAGHLCFSAFIVTLVLAIIFLAWYPAPYFEAAGARSIIRVLIGVDLVLGPLLTLIVFKPGKRLLIVDVAFIVTLQICALVYGLTVLYNERPYYVVFAIDRIHVFAEKDVAADARAAQPWIVKPAIGPVLASARRPDDIEAQQRLLEETVFGNAPDIERRPSFWVPLAEDLQALRDNALPLDLLRDAGAKEAAVVDETLAAHAGRDSELGIYPIIAANNDATAIVDLTTGELLRVVAAEPWSIVARQHE